MDFMIFLSPFHKAKNRVLATFSGSVARRGACSCSFKFPSGQVIIGGKTSFVGPEAWAQGVVVKKYKKIVFQW